MSFLATMFKLTASRNDRRRDAAIALPEGVKEYRDISYGPYDRWNLLDVYCPEDTQEPLPTIVSVHGGGWMYAEIGETPTVGRTIETENCTFTVTETEYN